MSHTQKLMAATTVLFAGLLACEEVELPCKEDCGAEDDFDACVDDCLVAEGC